MLGAAVAVATKLFRSGEVTHRDVCDALHLADGGGPGSFALANIRAGAAPGSFTVTPAGQRERAREAVLAVT